MAAEPAGSPKEIATALQEVTERAQVLVREEIELAKTEVTEKVTKLAKGAAVGAAAGVFAIFAVAIMFQGFAWLTWWIFFDGHTTYFWGFFIVAAVLFLLGGLAGYLATRLFKSGSPPKPEMAIEEAQLIRETVTGD